MSEPWNFTEAQRRQFREAHAEATRKRLTEDAPEAICGHEYELSNVAYRCERAPHPVDGYSPPFRHAALIDAELAKGTDEEDGYGTADLLTWGEDDNGDGQDWEIAWGTVADYGG